MMSCSTCTFLCPAPSKLSNGVTFTTAFEMDQQMSDSMKQIHSEFV